MISPKIEFAKSEQIYARTVPSATARLRRRSKEKTPSENRYLVLNRSVAWARRSLLVPSLSLSGETASLSRETARL